MSLDTFTGNSVPELFARVNEEVGEDAVLLSVRRLNDGPAAFEVTAADPETAAARRELELAYRATATAAQEAVDLGTGSTEETETALAPAPAAGPMTVPETPLVQRVAGGGDRPRTIALIGPTGSGKTTTLVKLANHTGAFGNRRVGVLSLDTYRPGAVEQLRLYTQLSLIPLEVAFEPADIPKALDRLGDQELILIDTPGRSPSEESDVEVVRNCLNTIIPDEVHLVLPAGLAQVHARRAANRARILGATHLLPTKLDEFPDLDFVRSLSVEFRLPIRWTGNGQRIPGDLQVSIHSPDEEISSTRGIAL